MNIVRNMRIGGSAMLLTLLTATPALAEDIEIYSQNNLGTSAVDPNIMFILDTSGSMDSDMMIDEQFDPTIDYSVRAGACFDNSRMYPSTTSDVSCTPTFRNNYFPISQNQCQAMTNAFNAVGMYTSTFAQWNDTKNFWGELKTNYNSDTNYIECDVDQGEHGNGGAETYINVGGGSNAYTASPANSSTAWTSIVSDTVTFYSGNWMNYKVTSSQIMSTRFDVMRDVIKNLVFGIDGVNVGLMRFDSRSDADGGSVVYEVQDVTASRDNMKNQMDAWSADGWTPLSETLYEAYLYFSGGEVDYGNLATPQSVGGSKINGDPTHYASPVDPDYAGCQRQFIIYLSDGLPTRDDDANSKIEGLPGFVSTDGSTSNCSGGSCLDDLAGYMNKHGFDVYLSDSQTIQDVRVNTYTIGFTEDIQILNDTAEEGGGEYFVAYSASDLLNTLTAIIREIKAIHTTFSSPAVSINAFNRSTHRDDLYFTLFKPATKPHWHGNFKRFKLEFDVSGNPEIVDVNGDPAVSSITGFFRDSSTSWWTPVDDAPDGRTTEKGGAASKLFTGNTFSTGRQVYSNVSNNNTLSASSNWVEPGNTNITVDMLGAPGQTAAYRTELLEWARGVDTKDQDQDGDNTDARRVMGDPLHAQPALVQYAGPENDPEIVAYVATNDGYLHAIDTRENSGEELFAFIPDDLLGNINTLYTNTAAEKTYGLDGNVTAWVNDIDRDGVIEAGSGEHVYIYFGMRRGGRNYYALDVTDRANPRFMWKIQGGASGALGDFTELGQSWSTPQLGKVQLGGSERQVLIFGGGYDTDQDSVLTRTADGMGRAIYIVDAESGNLLWSAGQSAGADLQLTNMNYSIPSDIANIDSDGDGLTDKLYVGDMGGQVWRIDIDNQAGATETSLANMTTGGRIADLADDTAGSNRRFYYPPDVALLKDGNNSLFLAVVIASGYRAHPTDRVTQDRMFMLRDKPIGTTSTYTTITENNTVHDLFDTTDNIIGQGSSGQIETAQTQLNSANGWYINLDQSIGEKSLTKPLIFAGEAFVTTYVPNDPSITSATSCEPQEGRGYLYHINVADGTPVKNYDQIVNSDPENLTREDRRMSLVRSGIPADPAIVSPGQTAICIGTECMKQDMSNTQKVLYWYEEEVR